MYHVYQNYTIDNYAIDNHHKQCQDQIHFLSQAWTGPTVHGCSFVLGPFFPVSRTQIPQVGDLEITRETQLQSHETVRGECTRL